MAWSDAVTSREAALFVASLTVAAVVIVLGIVSAMRRKVAGLQTHRAAAIWKGTADYGHAAADRGRAAQSRGAPRDMWGAAV